MAKPADDSHWGNSSQQDNAVNLVVTEDIARMWQLFDRLPFCIRAMIAIAPYEFSVQDVVNDYENFKTTSSRQDFFDSFISGREIKRPEEYARNMDRAFRDTVNQLSYSKVEINGSYKLVPKIHGVNVAGRKVHRFRSSQPRRRGAIFPPIPTGRGTWINY